MKLVVVAILIYFFHYQNEVARAIELREIVTSLGPAYIKLGQALSIRPDILSPVAMTELQKLCDKVTLVLPTFLYLLALSPAYVLVPFEFDILKNNKKEFH